MFTLGRSLGVVVCIGLMLWAASMAFSDRLIGRQAGRYREISNIPMPMPPERRADPLAPVIGVALPLPASKAEAVAGAW